MIWALLSEDGTQVLGLFANPQPSIPNVVELSLEDPRVLAFKAALPAE